MRLTAVCQTVVGGGSFCTGISPAELASCQSSTTAAGVISRYQPWCLRRWRPGRPDAPERAPAAGAVMAVACGPDPAGAAGAAAAGATRVALVVSGIEHLG